jgi:phosphatidylserine/phosphatidylglycerophosphate/cardiolipin synthase-like enzyme
MLVSPIATPASWTWSHADATDLPPALRALFPPTEASAAAPNPPLAMPPAVVGNGPATTLRFPWSGHARHHADGDVQWIWGRNGDLPRFPELRTRLPFGNPLIALRFSSTVAPAPGSFPQENARRQSTIVLAGSTEAIVTQLTVVASFPLRPGMDTLAVLRFLRTAFDEAFPESSPDRPLASSWAAFVDPLDPLPQRLRLLEPGGSPVPSRTVTLNRAAGPLTFTLAPAHRGDLPAAAGLDRAAFDAATSINVADGAPVLAATPGASFPTGTASVTTADSHLDLAVLHDWLAPNGAPGLPRFTRGNRVRPFVNGPEYFADLFTELNAPGTAGADGLFYLTGYSLFHDTSLVPASLGLAQRTVADVARAMAAGGAQARFLALQFVQLQPGVLETAVVSAQVAGALLSMASLVLAGFVEDGWDRANFVLHSQLISWGLIVGAPTVGTLMPALEANRGAIDALAAIAGVEAQLDPYIAGAADNPLFPARGANALLDAVRDLQERFGGYHQKIAVVRNDAGLVAYCGGIDLHPNRLDNRDHGIPHPYHDVHARIDGPAAADLATTFVERWQTAGRSTLAIGAPGAMPVVPPAGDDVVQIGRTYFGPGAGRSGLPFAPSGERTILDTQLAAVARARRYVYIEDQYLTPPAEYTDALVQAARRVAGPLIVVIPDLPDQPFGLASRQAFIAAMRAAWGERFKVGVLRLRLARAPTTITTAVGQLWLTQDVAEGDTRLKLGPVDRLPSFPFWLVVGNEVMRATRKVAPMTPPPASSVATEVEIEVERSEQTRLFAADRGTERKAHKARAAVTCGLFPGVYVHAKTMLIDDAFASIGSANINRRGYYSDGECNVFALREALTHGDNWIRELRIRLWAEALGTTEEYARVAFADPCARLELWDRRFTTGSRFTPFDAQVLANELELRTAITSNSNALDWIGFSALVLGGAADVVVGANAATLFDAVVDPSSGVAPP